jgi:nucleoside-diphosphate-sugar epimerase
MRAISITGASSFIGQHLINILTRYDDISINAMVSDSANFSLCSNNKISFCRANLLDYNTLKNFVVEGCTVINLAYLRNCDREANIKAMENLIGICERTKIKRFVHCSTAVVAGRVDSDIISETTICNPVNSYEETKLQLEEMLLFRASGKFESVILRPTAVFGSGGLNLIKLINELRSANIIKNYMKSCLYNTRKMNLVYVANVVSAIHYLADAKSDVDKQVFIISDDEYDENNYEYIEKHLMNKLGYAIYPIPKAPLHSFILETILKIAGRTNVNTKQIYSCQKLIEHGYKKSISFLDGLDEFIAWYKNSLEAKYHWSTSGVTN